VRIHREIYRRRPRIGGVVRAMSREAACAVELLGTRNRSDQGHSIATLERMLDVHYLAGRAELAESAIKKLSAVYGSA
jgi:ribulose-5-phosphate 4-epimerase/fuculose-1-phosphate aldolase